MSSKLCKINQPTENSTANQSFQSTMSPKDLDSSIDQKRSYECFNQPISYRSFAQSVWKHQQILWQQSWSCTTTPIEKTSTTRTSRWREPTRRPGHGAVPRTVRGPDRRPSTTRKASSIWTPSQRKSSRPFPSPTTRRHSTRPNRSHRANSSHGWTKLTRAASNISSAENESVRSSAHPKTSYRHRTSKMVSRSVWNRSNIPKSEETRTKMTPRWKRSECERNYRFFSWTTWSTLTGWKVPFPYRRQIFRFRRRFPSIMRTRLGCTSPFYTRTCSPPVVITRSGCFRTTSWPTSPIRCPSRTVTEKNPRRSCPLRLRPERFRRRPARSYIWERGVNLDCQLNRPWHQFTNCRQGRFCGWFWSSCCSVGDRRLFFGGEYALGSYPSGGNSVKERVWMQSHILFAPLFPKLSVDLVHSGLHTLLQGETPPRRIAAEDALQPSNPAVIASLGHIQLSLRLCWNSNHQTHWAKLNYGKMYKRFTLTLNSLVLNRPTITHTHTCTFRDFGLGFGFLHVILLNFRIHRTTLML